ncbi:MAG: diacylglycerol kinase [Gammaproteobacteria bacterium]
MATQGGSGYEHLVKATRYSFRGLKAAFRYEQAFRLELFLLLFLAPVGIWLGESGIERALLTGVLLLVLIVELINSGIEAVVDRFGDEVHELSGRAKDVGSAAVMLSLINVCVVWVLVLVF